MSVISNMSLRDTPAVTEKHPPFIPWDNPDNIISAATRATMEKVIICGATEVVMILGIPGNIVNLIVFTRQGLKDRVTLMLFCLALVDIINLTCYFSMNIGCFIQPRDAVLAWNVKTVQYPQVLYINLIAGLLSVSLVTILSVDRCIAITLPLKAARILTYKRTAITVVVVSTMIIVVNIPSLWLNSVTWITDPVSNRSMARLTLTKFALQYHPYRQFVAIFRMVITTVCVVAVVISCSITVKTLRAASKLRAKMSDENFHQSEIQITVMLLFVCMVMVICLIPDQVVMVVLLVVPDFYTFKKYHNSFIVCQYFIFFARSTNSASNFFLYWLLSSKFRATLMDLLPCRQK